jgi:limonene-1,2-epoxide hydrolase
MKETAMHDITRARRAFLGLSGASILAAIAASGRAAAQQARSELETRNIALVERFCASWSTKDLQKITALMADDNVYRMSETTPPITGHAAFVERLAPWMESSSSIVFQVLESFAMGPIVINHRIDRFQSSTRPLTWEGVGVFFVQDEKIKEWSDYTIAMSRV